MAYITASSYLVRRALQDTISMVQLVVIRDSPYVQPQRRAMWLT